MSQKLTYRPDIDGLRAVAVLGVVFYHAGLGFPGGYVGVDVFFVISGFLITSLILKDLRNGTFSLLDFWERRARRILPALTIVVVAVIIAGWFLLLPADYEVLGKQVIALIAFSSNIKFWRETGYFDAAAEEKPLLHTWSLSLEEQFYLFIPLLLALLFRIRKSKWIVHILLLGAAVSFSLSVYGSYRAPAATFFLLPMRAWELAAGSLLAFVAPITRSNLRSMMAWVGIAAILAPFFLYAPGIRFPGLTALPPVVGAGLLIWSGISKELILPLPLRLLASRPLVCIGLLSYSLYLWHWPLFAFQHYSLSASFAPFAPHTVTTKLLLVSASFFLAFISLNFVERPFRSRSFVRTRRLVFSLCACAVAILMISSLLLVATDGAADRLSEKARRFAAAKFDSAFIADLTYRDIPNNLVDLGVPGSPPQVFVWGDSHAMAILPAVDAACREAGIAGKAATASSTAPVMNWFKRTKYGLNEEAPLFNSAVMSFIRDSTKNRLAHVIIAARWEGYLDGSEEDVLFSKALQTTVRELAAIECNVVLLRESPRFPFDVPRSLSLNFFNGKSSVDSLRIHRHQYDKDTHFQMPILLACQTLGATLIDPAELYMDETGVIRPADESGAYYRDSHHLSIYGAMRLKPIFAMLMRKPGN